MKKTIFSVVLIASLCLLVVFSLTQKNETSETTTAAESTLSPTVTVTFPEGYTAVQIAKRLEENDVCSAEDFINQLQNIDELKSVYSFIGELSIENKAFALEGWLFPDTYEFYRGESAASVLSRFLKNTQSKLTDEYYQKAQELGYSMDEIITLASIIQKEADVTGQMPKVSSVLHNRLSSSDFPRIQCDVTINYLNDYVLDSPYLTDDTERFKELYNTYKCLGLPAGAICNPGIEAIDAALNPDDTDYYYFVTDSDNNYYYASTYKEHLENCKKCGISG